MSVNVKLLKKVRKLIADEPRRLDMSYWGMQVKHMKEKPVNPPPCGTVACLAGWTVLAANPKKNWEKLFHDAEGLVPVGANYPADTKYEAAKLLGLDIENCPFNRLHWKVPDVLAWIDEQIAGAKP